MAELHSVKVDRHQNEQTASSAVLIPKLLSAYGDGIAALLRLGDEISKEFDQLGRIERELRQYGCTPPRPDLSGELRAAWSHHRGEGFWER